jgi:hypothetical protein
MVTSTTRRGGNAVDARRRNGGREKLMSGEPASSCRLQIGTVFSFAVNVRPKLFLGYAGRGFELQDPSDRGRLVCLETLPNRPLRNANESPSSALTADGLDRLCEGV